jgi:hypothetical protein
LIATNAGFNQICGYIFVGYLKIIGNPDVICNWARNLFLQSRRLPHSGQNLCDVDISIPQPGQILVAGSGGVDATF